MFFKNVLYVISLCRYYISFKKDVDLHLNKIQFPNALVDIGSVVPEKIFKSRQYIVYNVYIHVSIYCVYISVHRRADRQGQKMIRKALFGSCAIQLSCTKQIGGIDDETLPTSVLNFLQTNHSINQPRDMSKGTRIQQAFFFI